MRYISKNIKRWLKKRRLNKNHKRDLKRFFPVKESTIELYGIDKKLQYTIKWTSKNQLEMVHQAVNVSQYHMYVESVRPKVLILRGIHKEYDYSHVRLIIDYDPPESELHMTRRISLGYLTDIKGIAHLFMGVENDLHPIREYDILNDESLD